MKQLAIDWGELSMAFDSSLWGASYYLDKETGQVLTVTDEDRYELERIYEEHFDPVNPDAFDIEQTLAEVNLPDWQKEGVKTTFFVEAHWGSRVIAIPDTSTYEAYDEMQEFISTVENDRLYNRLLEAIQGRGAFGRFQAILGQHLAEEQRWYAFQENRLRKRILEWLMEVGIEPIEVPQPVEVKMEDLQNCVINYWTKCSSLCRLQAAFLA